MTFPADQDRRNAMVGACAFMLAYGLFSSPASSPARAQAKPALRPVKIASAQGNQVVTMQELVKAQGYLEELGVDPEILTVGDGTKLIGALMSGGSDICVFAGFNQTLAAIEKGARMKIIAGASITGQQAVFSANEQVTDMSLAAEAVRMMG